MNAKKFKQELLEQLYEPYISSQDLLIENGSKRIIFGEGNPDARLVFIGEAPGAQEDLEGRPFVGRSGKLLNKILEAAGVKREEVFITNIVKCRPPNNRKPTPAEMDRSRALLLRQMHTIRPKVICTLGSCALEGLIGHPISISQLRGKSMQFNGLLVLPTYHPAYILRNPQELKNLTQDIFFACNIAHDSD